MSETKLNWKKGRGKLGIFDPLIGKWKAEAESEMGKVICIREYSRVLNSAYMQLNADWQFKGGNYKEIALIGTDKEGTIKYWSFTSDKKQSEGYLADVTDVHPLAIGFEAHMPAGLGRMAYWPDEIEGFKWIVESKTKKGWNRFVEHHYKLIE